MVVFACNNCGESLKKAQVANHLSWNKCRGCSVSCMDCSRDFDNVSYTHHIKCITEAEKYSGGTFKPKVSTLNNEKKREDWAELIGRVAADEKLNKSRNDQELLNYLSKLHSVPVKKKPFMSLVQNGAKRYMSAAESVWRMIEKERDASMSPVTNESPVKSAQNDTKKRSFEEETSETVKKVKKGDSEELSHKEMKKLKKQQKYEAELEEIQANEEVEETNTKKKKKKSKKSQESEEMVVEENGTGDKKKKKKKKSNQNENEEEEMEVEENIEELEGKKKKSKKSKHNGTEVEQNGTEKKKKMKNNGIEPETNGKKSKKRKLETEDETDTFEEKKSKVDEEVENGTKERFAWQDIISQIVGKKGSTTMKKLQRKVTSEYVSTCPYKPLSEKKLDAKLMKTLKKMPNIVVNDQCVELVQE